MPDYTTDDFKTVLYSVNRRVAKKLRDGYVISNNLTTQILLDQWNNQNGKCSCCGIALDLLGVAHKDGCVNEMRIAVDKHDPQKGYVAGNIRLMHQCCNMFKGTMPFHYVVAIAQRIVEKFKSDHPETTVSIAEELRERDGKQYVYPSFGYTSDGGKVEMGGSAETSWTPAPPKD